MEIIFATKNKGKMKEIEKIFDGTNFSVISMEQVGIDIDVVEDGKTFEDNALKKAVEIMKISGKTVLSDDSGLEIDFLDKRPGVESARFLGEHTAYDIKNEKILEMLQTAGEDRRTARFVSVIAAAFPDGRTFTTKGVIEGRIGTEAKGGNGFGYDPIFYIPEYSMTMAEMTIEQKNEISHRAIALGLMKEKLLELTV